MTTVDNVRSYKGSMDRAVYVGRPSPYGNTPGQRLPKSAALRAFLLYWYSPERAGLRALARVQLVGKILLCWCVPGSCHADIIANYLNRVVPFLQTQVLEYTLPPSPFERPSHARPEP